MRAVNSLLLLALAYIAALAWALPPAIDKSSLIQKDPPQANAALSGFKSLLDRRNTLTLRTPGIVVSYAPGTATKVLIKSGWMAMNMWQIVDLLRATINLASQRIAEHGDRVIPMTDLATLGGALLGEGIHMTLANANNHQLTYGVVSSAAMALADYVVGSSGYQSLDFQIIDGNNFVGGGRIVS